MVALLASAVLVGCGSKAMAPADAGAGGAGGGAGGAGGTVMDAPPAEDAAPDRSEVPADAQTLPPADVMFPDPPAMSCDDDGGAACDFPPPACATQCGDASSDCRFFLWLVYYDNPRCVNHACVYDRRYLQCEVNHICTIGGCQFNGTLPAPPAP